MDKFVKRSRWASDNTIAVTTKPRRVERETKENFWLHLTVAQV